MDSEKAWIEQARRQPSPNYDQRPPGTDPDLIVLHAISLPPSHFGGPWIDHLFCNRLDPDRHDYFREIHALRVSAHVLIRRDGSLVQYVPLTHRAWHAGQSRYAGRERCNDFSIGIELEGCDELPFEVSQYDCLARLIKTLWRAWPATRGNPLQGHCDIAPGRKTDPGPMFDWPCLHRRLHGGDATAAEHRT